MFQSKNQSFFSLLVMIFLLLCFFSVFAAEPVLSVFGSRLVTSKESYPTILLDAGHGGKDPGKVSEQGTLEKDINLAITLKVKQLLSQHPVNVILTRDKDTDLSTSDTNHKVSDLENRIKLIREHSPVLAISIHQNSYPDPSVVGAQCFYHKESESGKELARLLQNQIVTSTAQTKIREIKNNESYYILKHSPVTTAIVECGFLSSPKEEALLLSSEYQDRMAFAIHLGILQFLNNSPQPEATHP